MIDDAFICEAIRFAWERMEHYEWHDRYDGCESSLKPIGEEYTVECLFRMDDRLKTAGEEYFSKLVKGLHLEREGSVCATDVAGRIRQADPSLTVTEKGKDLLVKVPGDTIVIRFYDGRVWDIRSEKLRHEWSLHPFGVPDPDDLVRAVVAMGRFEELSAPLKEEYLERCGERRRRLGVKLAFRESTAGIRRSVCAALDSGDDPDVFRETYLPLRKAFYGELGDRWDDGLLERDWRDLVDYARETLDKDRAEAARLEARRKRLAPREKAFKEKGEELSGALGRECRVERKHPNTGTHWDEYAVRLSDGQVAAFRDRSKTPGAIDRDILALVPILEELLPFAASKMKLGRSSNPQVSYTDFQRKLNRREFLRMAGDDEVLLYLGERMEASDARVILRTGRRSVKLFCFYPGSNDSAVSFTLKTPRSREEVDRLEDIVSRFTSAMRRRGVELVN